MAVDGGMPNEMKTPKSAKKAKKIKMDAGTPVQIKAQTLQLSSDKMTGFDNDSKKDEIANGNFNSDFRGRSGGSRGICKEKVYDPKAVYVFFKECVNKATAQAVMDKLGDAEHIIFLRSMVVVTFSTEKTATAWRYKVEEMEFNGLKTIGIANAYEDQYMLRRLPGKKKVQRAINYKALALHFKDHINNTTAQAIIDKIGDAEDFIFSRRITVSYSTEAAADALKEKSREMEFNGLRPILSNYLCKKRRWPEESSESSPKKKLKAPPVNNTRAVFMFFANKINKATALDIMDKITDAEDFIFSREVDVTFSTKAAARVWDKKARELKFNGLKPFIKGSLPPEESSEFSPTKKQEVKKEAVKEEQEEDSDQGEEEEEDDEEEEEDDDEEEEDDDEEEEEDDEEEDEDEEYANFLSSTLKSAVPILRSEIPRAKPQPKNV